MSHDDELTIACMRTIFADEIVVAGGSVSDTYEDATRVFTRSILPWTTEVGAKDRVQGGVAMRAVERDVWVHPYVFRQVCRNGAIIAHALESQHLERLDFLTADVAADRLREAVRGCCVEDALSAAAAEMRSARYRQADVALQLLPFLSRSRSMDAARVVTEIMTRFLHEGDRSAFGLMNAVTSIARDTPDPEMRWRLEELGGGVPATMMPADSPGDVAASLTVFS